MDNPLFRYSPGGSWQISEFGADPGEPENPETRPSGTVEFEFQGEELDLLIATGNFWGYMLVLVDGEPANLLPVIDNPNPITGPVSITPGFQMPKFGFKTFYEPETQTEAEWRAAIPTTRWIRIHNAPNPQNTPRMVRIQIWRSWGQTPLRGVAVDALPPEPRPLWPGMLLGVLGFALLIANSESKRGLGAIWERFYQFPMFRWLRAQGHPFATFDRLSIDKRLAPRSPSLQGGSGCKSEPPRPTRTGYNIGVPLSGWTIAAAGVVVMAVGVILQLWWLTLLGLILLASTTLFSMVPWMAALLFGLPFYFGVTLPLLPGRAFGLLDVGIFGGIILLGVHCLLTAPLKSTDRVHPSMTTNLTHEDRFYLLGSIRYRIERSRIIQWLRIEHSSIIRWLLALLIGWALVAVFTADYFGPALREWRTVFLSGGLFAVMLCVTIRRSQEPERVRHLLVVAWLLGGTAVALIGLWQYVSGSMLITAEGVYRVRALYGSPNNLALYLDRTLAVSIALGLLLESAKWRWIWRGAAAIQLLALILTFSKGALFLGLPAMLVAIAAALWISKEKKQSADIGSGLGQSNQRVLIWIAVIAVVSVAALAPFLGTERFQRLLDFSQGTSFLRLQLWRGSWAMALDNPIFGVGPDNFLYSYRSDYILPSAWQERDLNHPHNWFLDWWTRLGIPGLLLGLAFWGAGLWRIIHRLRFGAEHSTFGSALHVGLLAAVMASLAHGLIDVSYALPDLMIVWVFLLLL